MALGYGACGASGKLFRVEVAEVLGQVLGADGRAIEVQRVALRVLLFVRPVNELPNMGRVVVVRIEGAELGGIGAFEFEDPLYRLVAIHLRPL